MNLAIRADGGSYIGMGHIMRCLNLAKAFSNAGISVRFISRFEDGINKIISHGFTVNTLGNSRHDDDGLCEEANEIISIIENNEIDFLLIDSYNITDEYFLSLKQHVKRIGYIDDVNKFVYPVDILINGNITGLYMEYTKYSNEEIMLLGPDYNLIREEFKNLKKRTTSKEVKEFLITTGGSDPYELSYRLADIILENSTLSSLIINIIIADTFKNKTSLRELSQRHKNIVLHENVNNLSEVMEKCDFAISSGGSTLYELCACGTPTLAFIMADNQECLVKKMNELGYVINLGWYDKLNKESICCRVQNFINDFELRKSLAEKGQDLVDTKGAERVVDKILKTFFHDSGGIQHE